MGAIIPQSTNPVWANLITGKVKPTFDFLGIKIFLGHAGIEYEKNKTPENLKKLSNDLRELFVKNEKLSTVQKDIEKINK